MKKGFTLTELLVTVGIITLLSGLVVINYPSSRASSQVVDDLNSLNLLVRTAQNRSLSPYKEDLPIGSDNLCGMGIYLVNNSNIIKTYYISSPTSCDLVTNYTYDPSRQYGSDIVLSNSIIRLTTTNLSLAFSLPFSKPQFGTALITVQHKSDLSASRLMQVNNTGLIKIQ